MGEFWIIGLVGGWALSVPVAIGTFLAVHPPLNGLGELESFIIGLGYGVAFSQIGAYIGARADYRRA